MTKKILVTGGFGFIGTTLVELLLDDEQDTEIHVIDDLSTSPIDVEDFLNEAGRPARLKHDITTVEQFFSKDDVGAWDEIYHLASPVGPAGVLRHAGNMVRDVVRDAYLICDYAMDRGCKVLDVSTSEIYGGGEGGYCPESTPKIVPAITTVRLEYAIAKLAAETAITNLCECHDLKATIVRPFNVAGPRQSPKGGFVLPRFVQQAYEGLPITVFNDGSAVRAFTHVKDMASGIILAMKNGENGTAYNVGNPENKTTILELAQIVKSVLDSESEISFVDPKTIYGNYYEEANDKYPDAQRAMNELGWKPKYGISETIADAKDEFLRQLGAKTLKDHV